MSCQQAPLPNTPNSKAQPARKTVATLSPFIDAVHPKRKNRLAGAISSPRPIGPIRKKKRPGKTRCSYLPPGMTNEVRYRPRITRRITSRTPMCLGVRSTTDDEATQGQANDAKNDVKCSRENHGPVGSISVQLRGWLWEADGYQSDSVDYGENRENRSCNNQCNCRCYYRVRRKTRR